MSAVRRALVNKEFTLDGIRPPTQPSLNSTTHAGEKATPSSSSGIGNEDPGMSS